MANYSFKLLGGFGDRAEIDLELEFESTVAEVKEHVRKGFRIIPGLQIDLMAGGKKLSDGQTWGMCDVIPNKTTILVIGHRNN